ncbi:terminal nucleotidyltransferase 4A isoform X1 [Dendrobium catenatum]|uniref:terminal nucleotidyltransferase 4A isoform X1 n=1 Tax=Dendrobium catenatum TaxID=906689 RepID=UPI0009F5B6A4|nr:terminal nucleotidyltransferase 4A isoform X1 [Dendrobium catenatum]
MGEESTSISYIYETLDPLGFSEEHDPDATGSYAVFRSEVTASADLIVDIPVSDYFSLDVSGDSPQCELDESLPLQSVSTAAAPGSPEAACPVTSESTWFRAGSRFRSPMLQLHKEILDFSAFVSPTPEEKAKRETAVDRVFQVVKYIWPHCRVEVFGSFRTGLYLPTSDIDVVILDSKVKTPQTGLYALSRALSQKGIAKQMQVISKARVPIVKFVEKQSGIAFDMSFDVDGGPKAANFIKDAVEKIPPLRHLCLILKVFLQQRELNEVYSGGIGSYALLAMLIAHLQLVDQFCLLKSNFLPRYKGDHKICKGSKSPWSRIWESSCQVKFFEFYGRKLNTSDVGVSCKSSSTFFLKCDRGFFNTGRPYLLAIEDPQDPDNDIGKNSYNYYKVRSAFAVAYSSLTDARTIKSLGSQKSILGTIIRPDPLLLDRKGGSNGELTFNKLLPGAGESVTQQFGFNSNIIYNWQLVDDEPFPRESILVDDEIAAARKQRTFLTKRITHQYAKKVRNFETREEDGNLNGSSMRKRMRFPDRDLYGQNSLPHYSR